MSLNSNAHKNQKVIVESCVSDILIHDQQNNIQLEQDGNTQITGESPDGENLQIPFPLVQDNREWQAMIIASYKKQQRRTKM